MAQLQCVKSLGGEASDSKLLIYNHHYQARRGLLQLVEWGLFVRMPLPSIIRERGQYYHSQDTTGVFLGTCNLHQIKVDIVPTFSLE